MAGVVGTGVQQPTAQLQNTLDAISTKYIDGKFGDVVFKPSPLLWALFRRGRKFDWGAEVVYPLITTVLSTRGPYWGDQLLNTTVIDPIQPANQVWRPYYQNLSLPVTDIILGRGGPIGMDLVKSMLQVAAGSMLDMLSNALWGVSPFNSAIDVDNIVAWVQTTNNTIAGINRSTSTFWNPTANFAGGGTPLTPANAELAYQGVVLGYDEPDIIAMDNTRFAGFKNQFTPLVRFSQMVQDKEALQAGFRYHFIYNNAVVIADPFAPAQTAFILNSKYIWPIFNANDYFKVDPWIRPSNQRVVVSQIFLTWQVASNSPRMNRAVTGLA